MISISLIPTHFLFALLSLQPYLLINQVFGTQSGRIQPPESSKNSLDFQLLFSPWCIKLVVCYYIEIEMQSSSSFLGLSQQFQPYQIALALILTIYTGLFVMVSNHYVFKPKVELFFLQSSITSQALHQFLIDFLTNLSPLTFLVSTLLLMNTDSALSVMIYSDISWSGLLVAFLAFRGVLQKDEENDWKLMLIKNVIFLAMIYGIIAGHYLSQLYYISLGICLFLLYIFNLLIDANEDKFISFMEMLFNYKSNNQIQHEYQQSNNMIHPEYLAKQFPVTSDQIKAKMKSYEGQIRKINLKTKALVTEKLMKIAMAVHLSKQKMENKAKRDIKYYYGTFNGTVLEKSRRFIMDKRTTHQENETQSEIKQQVVEAEEQFNNAVIFYVFPVKLFESNRIISIIFSVLINLGFGFLLSLTLTMTSTFRFGQYLQFLYGLLLLPVLPSISKQEFFHSMTLSSLWKYCLYGLLLIINCITTNNFPNFNFKTNLILSFAPVSQIIALILVIIIVLSKRSSEYKLMFVWLVAMVFNSIMIFKFC